MDELHSDVNDVKIPVVRKNRKNIFYFFSVVIFLSLFYFLFLSAPQDFPGGTIFKIEPGENLRNVSLDLKQKHLIRSRLVFEAFVIIFGREKHIVSAYYYFESKLPVYEIARRIGRGEHGMAPVVVTIPEGFNINQIAEAFSSKLPNFDKSKFLNTAQEGYLFPDTYFFLEDDDEVKVLHSMTDNFEKKIATLEQDILSAKKTEKEIVIMASIIEKEAKGTVEGKTDRGIISGILWKRLRLGIALQVDAAPETYKKKGLPKKPVSNPGLESLEAAIRPENSEYLYYLHDRNGVVHYAKTFAEHQANIRKYL